MDQVLADTLTANLKAAKTTEEQTSALTLAMIAMVDCQRKTADRVKDLHAAKDRVLWIGRLVWGLAAGGGFTVLVKALKVIGVL
jgi:hypothetical protein